MGRPRKAVKTDDMLVDEILMEMDNLRKAGLDLSRMTITKAPKASRDADLYSQWDGVVANLKATGANLNIPIVSVKG